MTTKRQHSDASDYPFTELVPMKDIENVKRGRLKPGGESSDIGKVKKRLKNDGIDSFVVNDQIDIPLFN